MQPAVPSNKPTVAYVTEYVLRSINPDGTHQGVFSDEDLELVRHERRSLTRDAKKSGRTVPNYEIAERACSYPLDAEGRRLAQGSTCDETVIE